NAPRLGTNWILWFAGMLIICLVFTMLLTRRIVEPLERLGAFARQIGMGLTPDPLPLTGPKEIQQVNESFNLMQQDLTRLANDREVLLAGVSHDLRTPITRLRLEVELAPISEETKEAMCSDLDQMETIVKQFMAYVREGTQPLEPVDLSKTVKDEIEASRFLTNPNVKLTTDIDDGIEIRANPTDISRAIQNILVNAEKYGKSQDGKLRMSIVLKLNKRRNTAELTASDDGPGISEDQFDRILRPF
ncbi:MAG: HAMP domain-containing protein, partial [Burkholderiales bacterium]|nr:HAMP domain-containing protein [Burkholderiales bacterium]